MTIWLYTVVRNEAKIMPWFLRHYARFCDRITIVDDRSDDGTREMVKSRLAGTLAPPCEIVLEDYPHTSGLDDRDLLAFAKATYKRAHGSAHWCIWVDADEFLYHPDLLPTLERLRVAGIEVPLMRGYQMLSEVFPQESPAPGATPDATRETRVLPQITELITEGVEDPTYGKPCLFMPHVDMDWELGKHYVHGNLKRGEYAGLKLLHYRCLGLDYLRERHARNYARCSQANLDSGLGVGTYPGWTGHMSEPWFKSILPTKTVVIPPA